MSSYHLAQKALALEEKVISKKRASSSLDMSKVTALILGGGEGRRLFPLTQSRCKPAISFAGKYRLIDVPISNAIHSGCQHIFVLTQFLSTSLHKHISQTYVRQSFHRGSVDVLSAEQKPSDKKWFQGTADAIRQCLDYLEEVPAEYFLILSGDQLYKANFQEMVRFARLTETDVVIASLPVSEKEAKRMGILKLNKDSLVEDFIEKPQDLTTLEAFALSKKTREKWGLDPSENKPFIGSMGIYLFKRDALFRLLKQDPREDFGKHLIPTKVKEGSVSAYLHQGYWEDIGTIGSFYEANMAMTKKGAIFDVYDEKTPLFSLASFLPGAKILGTQITDSIINEGVFCEADEVTRSILGSRTVIRKGCIIRDAYLMGQDFYQRPVATDRLPENIEIGEDCIIRHAILDKNVSLGRGVQLINKEKKENFDGENFYIRDGIIVIPRGAVLKEGVII